MSFEQPVTAAEADLERLLTIEPSIEFRSRVRARVAAESLNRRALPWRLVVATAGMVMAVATGLLVRPPAVDRPARPSAPPLAVNAVHRPDAIPFFLQPVPNPVERVARHQREAAAAREAEVIWDARDAVAIARVVELARRGTIIAAPKAPETNPLVVQPLSVVPITIDPVMPSTGLERSSS